MLQLTNKHLYTLLYEPFHVTTCWFNVKAVSRPRNTFVFYLMESITLMKNSFLNHGWIVFWICLKLSEFQLNHMIPSISELILKFGRIQPIFRKIQICVSEKFRFGFQLFWMCLNSGWIVFWICLNFSWITFLNYYWNSDEFSQYSEKFRFAFQKTLVHIHFWIITEFGHLQPKFRFVFQKNSEEKFMLIWILAKSSSECVWMYTVLIITEFWIFSANIQKVQICFSEQFRQKSSAVNQKCPPLPLSHLP